MDFPEPETEFLSGLLEMVAPEIQEYMKACRNQILDERAQMVNWAMVFCECPHSFDWDYPNRPPQVMCPVHGTFIMVGDHRYL
jgi:hypothetical protein